MWVDPCIRINFPLAYALLRERLHGSRFSGYTVISIFFTEMSQSPCFAETRCLLKCMSRTFFLSALLLLVLKNLVATLSVPSVDLNYAKLCGEKSHVSSIYVMR